MKPLVQSPVRGGGRKIEKEEGRKGEREKEGKKASSPWITNPAS